MKSLYHIPDGCICMGDGLFGMRCDAPEHARKINPSREELLGTAKKILEKSNEYRRDGERRQEGKIPLLP